MRKQHQTATIPTDSVEEESTLMEVPPDWTGEEPLVDDEPDGQEQEPVAPPIDIEAIKAEAKAEAIKAVELRQQEEWQRQQAQLQWQQAQQYQNPSFQQQYQQAPVQSNQYEQLEQRIFAGDAAGALRDLASQIREEVRREVLGEVNQRVSPLAVDRVVDEIAGDFGKEAKNQIRELIRTTDTSTLTPQGKDILRRLARDYDREAQEKVTATQKRMRPEPVGLSPTRLQVDKTDFDRVNSERRSIGLPPINATQYQQLLKEVNR